MRSPTHGQGCAHAHAGLAPPARFSRGPQAATLAASPAMQARPPLNITHLWRASMTVEKLPSPSRLSMSKSDTVRLSLQCHVCSRRSRSYQQRNWRHRVTPGGRVPFIMTRVTARCTLERYTAARQPELASRMVCPPAAVRCWPAAARAPHPPLPIAQCHALEQLGRASGCGSDARAVGDRAAGRNRSTGQPVQQYTTLRHRAGRPHVRPHSVGSFLLFASMHVQVPKHAEQDKQ